MSAAPKGRLSPSVAGALCTLCSAILPLLALGCSGLDTTPSESTALPASLPYFLSYNDRVGTELDAERYIAANGQEKTFADFQKARCMVEGATIDYFNFADLALGRRLSFARCQGRISACVENFGMPGQGAVDGLHAFQTGSSVAVCMDYLSSRPRGYKTQFYVYTDGLPDNGVHFDSQGKKFSPFACTACHGGRYVDAGTPARQVEHGFFLPLLKESLVFPEAPDEETLRKMNALIYETHDSEDRAPGVLQLLDAAYPSDTLGKGVHRLGAEYVKNALPASWKNDEELYRGLVHPHCLTCHAAQIDGGTPLNTPDQMLPLHGLIQQVACVDNVMPNSLEGNIRFRWDRTAKNLAGCH